MSDSLDGLHQAAAITHSIEFGCAWNELLANAFVSAEPMI